MKIGSIIVSITLSFLIMFNSMQITLTFAYYEIDPISFIEQLCENKDQPELSCNGKCQLKKVAESNSGDKNTPFSMLDFKDILLYNELPIAYQITCSNTNYSFNDYYLNLYSFTGLKDCFHPPQSMFS